MCSATSVSRCVAARHQQRRARACTSMRAGNAVDLAQPGFAHAHQPRRLGRLHGRRRHPGRPAWPVGPAWRASSAQEAVGVVVGQQHLRRAGGQDHRLVVLRVEVLELLQRHARQLRRQRDVDVAFDRHRSGSKGGSPAAAGQAEGLGAGHDDSSPPAAWARSCASRPACCRPV